MPRFGYKEVYIPILRRRLQNDSYAVIDNLPAGRISHGMQDLKMRTASFDSVIIQHDAHVQSPRAWEGFRRPKQYLSGNSRFDPE